MVVVTAEEILQEFVAFGVGLTNDAVIDKMMELCILHKIAAADLVEYWFAFSTSNQLDSSEPTVLLLNKLENEALTKKVEKKTPQNAFSAPRSSDFGRHDLMNNDNISLLKDYGTPVSQCIKKRQISPDQAATTRKKFLSPTGAAAAAAVPLSPAFSSPSMMSLTPTGKYSSRTNAGDVVNEFGSNVNAHWDQSKTFQCVVTPFNNGTTLAECYRYMFSNLDLVSSVLNNKIELMAAVYQQNLGVKDFADIRALSSEEVTVVGRIVCDSNGKLNPSSILIEGSHETSGGSIVHLDVGNIPTYSFFPGQVVACTGSNVSGGRFSANKLHPGFLPPLPETSPDISAEEPLTVMVAVGSYMTSDSLSFDPLCDFLRLVESQKPHACILIGPFVDCKHKEIEETNVANTFGELFTNCMELILNCARCCVSTKFVIVPSSRDVVHDYVYPTPPFSVSLLHKNEQNVYFVSDPSIINISGLVVGITSTDILLHLGKEEIIFPSMSDRLGRLLSHLMFQRSFYPLYPPSEEMNIDYAKLEAFTGLPILPHLLIIPSDLTCFVKDVHGCCCVNPQRITKGTVGGTYARLRVQATDDSASSNCVASQISCQVIRI